MTSTNYLAALKAVAPFDRMPDAELGLLLEFADVRQHLPDAIVHRGATAPPRIYVVLAGSVVGATGDRLGPVIGLAAMFEPPSAEPLTADAREGATLLSIDRQTFFTLARACPQLVRGFLEIEPGGMATPRRCSPVSRSPISPSRAR